MEALKYHEIREIILCHLYFIAINDVHGGSLDSADWRKQRPLPVSTGLFLRIANSLAEEELVESGKTSWGTGYEITQKGIEYVESKLNDDGHIIQEMLGEKYVLPQRLPQHNYSVSSFEHNAWKKPDNLGEVTEETREKIVSNLADLKAQVEKLDLSNEDKQQALSRIDSAITLSSAPIPPWETVKNILEPLSQLAAVGAFVLMIIQMISGS